MTSRGTNERQATGTVENTGRAQWHLPVVLEVIMATQLIALTIEQKWLDAFLVLAIMAATISPALVSRLLGMGIPQGLQILAIAFLFAAFFLGEIRGYYLRIWWWDIALHFISGLLLGIVGFLLVHALNEDARITKRMHPQFVAFFAFTFAVACGALWEMFEFVVDLRLGTQMQKPGQNDPSGLTDTMWDMIVDTIGAAAISVYGWRNIARREPSFIDRWIENFVRQWNGGRGMD